MTKKCDIEKELELKQNKAEFQFTPPPPPLDFKYTLKSISLWRTVSKLELLSYMAYVLLCEMCASQMPSRCLNKNRTKKNKKCKKFISVSKRWQQNVCLCQPDML